MFKGNDQRHIHSWHKGERKTVPEIQSHGTACSQTGHQVSKQGQLSSTGAMMVPGVCEIKTWGECKIVATSKALKYRAIIIY